ncbi:MAG: hypothetical protein IT305_20350, partial [Chloroflexi bacterium]|nr:hypothetical protein [Chloroflexota bacterium]
MKKISMVADGLDVSRRILVAVWLGMRAEFRARMSCRATVSRLAGLAILIAVSVLAGRSGTPVTVAQAPVAPILLVVNSVSPNSFGPYLGEILRTEGVTSFEVVQLNTLSQQTLAAHPIVILAETPLTQVQATMLSSYVSSGGSLIAMRPDTKLAPTLGLSAVGAIVQDAYVMPERGHPVSEQIVHQSLQTHGPADQYTLAGATKLATLYSGPSAATPYPAVTVSTLGGGRSAAFTYDLARAVAYLRQGNPAWAGTDHDGDGVVRTIDAFSGWVDLDRAQVLQADEQQRLFRNLITYFSTQSTPIPQFWYFPHPENKSLLVVTGDEHGQADSVFESMATIVERYSGHMSFYKARWGQLSAIKMNDLRNRGHEFGVHAYGAGDGHTLDEGFAFVFNWLAEGGYPPPSRTYRNHQVEWQGWVAAANVAQQYGEGMSLDFYHWGPWLQKPGGQWICSGYSQGTGQPMKFVDQNGVVLNVFQQPTTLVDEHMIQSAGAGYCNFSETRAIDESKQVIDRAISQDHAAVTMQAHADYGALDWLDGTLAYAQSKGLPIWTAERWLDFTTARQSAIVDQLSWDANTRVLRFCVSASGDQPSLTLLVPAAYGGQGVASIVVGGQTVAPVGLNLKGFGYTAFTVASGTRPVTVAYQAGSVVQPVCAVHEPDPTPTATIAATSTPTSTATAVLSHTPAATATATLPAATPVPAVVNGEQTDTTVADFAACGVPSGLTAADVAGGEVRLAAALEDYFGSPPSAGRWTWGTWG